VDVPNIPNLYPGDWFSRIGSFTFGCIRATKMLVCNGKSRYDYNYSDQELLEWIEALTQAADKADRALMLFNNCHGSQAALNAQRVQQLLAK